MVEVVEVGVVVEGVEVVVVVEGVGVGVVVDGVEVVVVVDGGLATEVGAVPICKPCRNNPSDKWFQFPIDQHSKINGSNTIFSHTIDIRQ